MYKSYIYCVVPKCESTTIRNPKKVFFRVPEKDSDRLKWMKAIGRDFIVSPLSPKSRSYVCEDHFNIKEDMENYMEWKLMGGRKRLKKNVVPHKFPCQLHGQHTAECTCLIATANRIRAEALQEAYQDIPSTSKESLQVEDIKPVVEEQNDKNCSEPRSSYVFFKEEPEDSYFSEELGSEKMIDPLSCEAVIKNEPSESSSCELIISDDSGDSNAFRELSSENMIDPLSCETTIKKEPSDSSSCEILISDDSGDSNAIRESSSGKRIDPLSCEEMIKNEPGDSSSCEILISDDSGDLNALKESSSENIFDPLSCEVKIKNIPGDSCSYEILISDDSGDSNALRESSSGSLLFQDSSDLPACFGDYSQSLRNVTDVSKNCSFPTTSGIGVKRGWNGKKAMCVKKPRNVQVVSKPSKDDDIDSCYEDDSDDIFNCERSEDEYCDDHIEDSERTTVVGPNSIIAEPSEAIEFSTSRPTVPDLPFTRHSEGVYISNFRHPIVNSFAHPRQFFDFLIDSDILDHIVQETNNHAESIQSSSSHTKAKQWTPLITYELLTFLGLLFHMGTVLLPKISLYWAEDPVLFDFPSFRRCMSRERFLQILHFFSNPESCDFKSTDRLFKVFPLLQYFHDTMEQVVTPDKKICISAPLLLWSGEYSKNRTQSYSIKVHMLTDPQGLVLRMIFSTDVSKPTNTRQSQTDSIVLNLLEGHLDMGHEVFMDDYYTSLGIVQYLLKRKTYTTGCLRPDQTGNPKQIILAKSENDEVIEYFANDGTCIFKWKNGLMISSKYTGKKVVNKSCFGIGRVMPEAMAHYSNLMEGVRKYEQMMLYYPFQKKTFRLCKKFDIHVLHTLFVNSFFLYNMTSLKKLNLLDFRNKVIRTLLPIEIPDAVQNSSDFRSIKGLSKHRLDYIEEGGKKKTMSCQECFRNSVTKKTMFLCPVCPGKPALCPVFCFDQHHSDMKLEELYDI